MSFVILSTEDVLLLAEMNQREDWWRWVEEPYWDDTYYKPKQFWLSARYTYGNHAWLY